MKGQERDKEDGSRGKAEEREKGEVKERKGD